MLDLILLVLAVMLVPWGSTSEAYPWIYPGDFRKRLEMSDLVVSGTISGTRKDGTNVVDGTTLTANVADIRLDRMFQGHVAAQQISFTFFTPYIHTGGGGVVYSGPPFADLHPKQRYLVFLKRKDSGWQVAMPLYALEVKLAAPILPSALRDLSQAPVEQRYAALAEELEAAALALPPPPAGLTGEAVVYFPAVYDLLAGCAGPFYRKFSTSSSPELRQAAVRWTQLIRSRNLKCKDVFLLPLQ